MKHYILLIAGLIITGTISAQKVVSLNDSRNMALEYNKTLKRSDLSRLAAEANRKEARTAYLPKIDATGQMTWMPSLNDMVIPGAELDVVDAGGNATGNKVKTPEIAINTEGLRYYTGSVAMQVPIYTGGAIRYANQMADEGVEIAEQAYQLKSDEVVYNVDEAYWRLIAFKEQLKVVTKYYEMLDSLEKRMTDMYELGLTPKSEKLKVAVQKNEAKLNLLRSENGLRIMKMNLCRIIGLPLNTDIDASEDLNENPELISMSSSIENALTNRNELRMLDGQKRISELQKKSVISNYMPSVGAQVSYGYNKVDNIYEGEYMATIGAQVSIPLIHWKEKKHKKEAARLKVQQAHLEFEETQELVQLEVQQNMIQVTEAYEAIVLAKKSKEEAIETLDEVSASFDAGLNTTTDVLNAQASWLSANASLLEALATFEISKTAYYKGIGLLDVEHQKSTN